MIEIFRYFSEAELILFRQFADKEAIVSVARVVEQFPIIWVNPDAHIFAAAKSLGLSTCPQSLVHLSFVWPQKVSRQLSRVGTTDPVSSYRIFRKIINK